MTIGIGMHWLLITSQTLQHNTYYCFDIFLVDKILIFNFIIYLVFINNIISTNRIELKLNHLIKAYKTTRGGD